MSNIIVDRDTLQYATLSFTRGAGENYEVLPLQGVFFSDKADAIVKSWEDLKSSGQVLLMRYLIKGDIF